MSRRCCCHRRGLLLVPTGRGSLLAGLPEGREGLQGHLKDRRGVVACGPPARRGANLCPWAEAKLARTLRCR